MPDTQTDTPVTESRDLFRCFGPLDRPKGADAGRTLRPVTQDMKHPADCGDHVHVPRQRKIEEEGPMERPFGCPQSERLRGFLSAVVA